MNVYIKPTLDWDWMVWVGEDANDTPTDDVKLFHPGNHGEYWLDAYSYARTLADELGYGLREVHQDK